MPPKLRPSEQPELFRSALLNLVDRRHALVRLASLIDWERFAAAFGPHYRDGVGRPGLPTRLMVGLHLIKHMDGLSDEAACARFLDSPYIQLFCGETHFQHALPLDRSSLSRWRKRIGPERLERHCHINSEADVLHLSAVLPVASCCHLGVGFLLPDPEGIGASALVGGRRHQVPAWTEMAVDHAVR
jgi:hypothetical protein